MIDMHQRLRQGCVEEDQGCDFRVSIDVLSILEMNLDPGTRIVFEGL
jgi:hypothetical protein